MRDEHIFVTCFCGQYLTVFLTPNLAFFTDEAWFHQSGYVNTQNNRYWSSINPRHPFEVPLHNHKIGVWCAITATQTVLFKSKRETF
jgi:hypothetical protein